MCWTRKIFECQKLKILKKRIEYSQKIFKNIQKRIQKTRNVTQVGRPDTIEYKIVLIFHVNKILIKPKTYQNTR